MNGCYSRQFLKKSVLKQGKEEVPGARIGIFSD
jgi:hypothetical protein